MAEALLIPQFEQDLSDYALKSYVDSAVSNKDVGVTKFNNRTGAVSPQSGDYTYSMVGAAASSHSHDYASSNHTHGTTYAAYSHTHSYASSNHSHSEYASSSHTHSGYASSTHTHSYASSSHTHSGYASSSHTHSSSDITGLSSGACEVIAGNFTGSTGNWTQTFSSPVKLLMYTSSSTLLNSGYALHGATGWVTSMVVPFSSTTTGGLSLSADGRTVRNSSTSANPGGVFIVWH